LSRLATDGRETPAGQDSISSSNVAAKDSCRSPTDGVDGGLAGRTTRATPPEYDVDASGKFDATSPAAARPTLSRSVPAIDRRPPRVAVATGRSVSHPGFEAAAAAETSCDAAAWDAGVEYDVASFPDDDFAKPPRIGVRPNSESATRDGTQRGAAAHRASDGASSSPTVDRKDLVAMRAATRDSPGGAVRGDADRFSSNDAATGGDPRTTPPVSPRASTSSIGDPSISADLGSFTVVPPGRRVSEDSFDAAEWASPLDVRESLIRLTELASARRSAESPSSAPRRGAKTVSEESFERAEQRGGPPDARESLVRLGKCENARPGAAERRTANNVERRRSNSSEKKTASACGRSTAHGTLPSAPPKSSKLPRRTVSAASDESFETADRRSVDDARESLPHVVDRFAGPAAGVSESRTSTASYARESANEFGRPARSATTTSLRRSAVRFSEPEPRPEPAAAAETDVWFDEEPDVVDCGDEAEQAVADVDNTGAECTQSIVARLRELSSVMDQTPPSGPSPSSARSAPKPTARSPSQSTSARSTPERTKPVVGGRPAVGRGARSGPQDDDRSSASRYVSSETARRASGVRRPVGGGRGCRGGGGGGRGRTYDRPTISAAAKQDAKGPVFTWKRPADSDVDERSGSGGQQRSGRCASRGSVGKSAAGRGGGGRAEATDPGRRKPRDSRTARLDDT